MSEAVDFGAVFGRLAGEGRSEETTLVGGVSVRLVRVAGGGAARWDRHDGTAETVIVWAGDFRVAFRDRSLELGAGQCCVVPVGVEHSGTSQNGAEVILLQSVAG